MKKAEDPESKDIKEHARTMVATLMKGIEDPEEKIPQVLMDVLREQFGKDCMGDAGGEVQAAGIKQQQDKQHVAEVKLLGSFDLGKNTGDDVSFRQGCMT